MVTAVTGHYGCGKTELAINLALNQLGKGLPVYLADLDIVNPYFCTRERKQLLEERGINVIVSLGGMQIDIPALPAQINTMFEPNVCGIMDVGGDPVGARVLARYEKQFCAAPYELIFVLNFNRPEVSTVQRAMDYINMVQASSRLNITALANNTHLLNETAAEDVLRGAELANEVSAKTALPLKFNCVKKSLIPQVSNLKNLLPIEIFMNKPWEV